MAVPATVIKPAVDLQHVENSRVVRLFRYLPAPSYRLSVMSRMHVAVVQLVTPSLVCVCMCVFCMLPS